MTDTDRPTPARACRAIGAMFFAAFGAAWLIFGAQIAFAAPRPRPDEMPT